MYLFEYEGKKIWTDFGIAVPDSVLVSRTEVGALSLPDSWPGYVVKAQTLSGNRAAKNLITLHVEAGEAQSSALTLLQRTEEFPELDKVLIEERIPYSFSLYIAISYSTALRTPLLLMSAHGGSGIEQQTSIARHQIDPLIGLQPAHVRQTAFQLGLSAPQQKTLIPEILKLWECFVQRDCLLAEINPFIDTKDGWMALDAKIILDDDATFRHTDHNFSARNTVGRLPTASELKAWQIDKGDHRGVAGTSYIDLVGDIGILASGGGASLACLDALVALGGKPANYTEYSGNPPREKVKQLTEIVLSKPGLKGCWVVGATANFTDILETLSGFLDGVRATTPKPTYPFLIRRAGPHEEEAFALLKKAAAEEGYAFHLYGAETPMISTAAMMMELIKK